MSDIENEKLLDVDTADNGETHNTFGRNQLRRLGIPHGHMEAEAASIPPPSDNFSVSLLLFGTSAVSTSSKLSSSMSDTY